jgi:hypothetical protein
MLPTLIVVPLNVVDVFAAKLPTATVVCVALSVNEISALPVASTETLKVPLVVAAEAVALVTTPPPAFVAASDVTAAVDAVAGVLPEFAPLSNGVPLKFVSLATWLMPWTSAFACAWSAALSDGELKPLFDY